LRVPDSNRHLCGYEPHEEANFLPIPRLFVPVNRCPGYPAVGVSIYTPDTYRFLDLSLHPVGAP